MNRSLFLGLLCCAGFVACQSKTDQTVKSNQPAPMPHHQQHSTTPSSDASPATFTAEMVVNKKDFICEMPVSAGISDTCHVDGKAYGFCSHECMLEFKASPSKYLSAQ